jgi:hypothetical protein
MRSKRDVDLITVADIKEVLGKETIPFLRRMNFHTSGFPVFKTDPIRMIIDHREGAEHEFLDIILAELRTELLVALLEMQMCLERFAHPESEQLLWHRLPQEWRERHARSTTSKPLLSYMPLPAPLAPHTTTWCEQRDIGLNRDVR